MLLNFLNLSSTVKSSSVRPLVYVGFLKIQNTNLVSRCTVSNTLIALCSVYFVARNFFPLHTNAHIVWNSFGISFKFNFVLQNFSLTISDRKIYDVLVRCGMQYSPITNFDTNNFYSNRQWFPVLTKTSIVADEILTAR